MKEFECKRCGTVIYLQEEEKKEPRCPQCRGSMKHTGISKEESELEKYKCSDCKKVFYMNKGVLPYKCPFSNYTFAISPRLKQEERL